MTVKVGINGFGRIGRNVLRAIVESGRIDVEVVAINDLGPVETNAHLLRYDSMHGKFPGTISVVGSTIDVGNGPIRVTAIQDPELLPWADVDVALECTGLFTDSKKASLHLANGSDKVLVSAPCGSDVKTIVYGVIHHSLNGGDRVVSNASCTTNCLSPVVQVLHDSFGIESGYMTTVHSYTGDQPTLDTMHKDLYRSRAAALSMIPTSTGAAEAVGLIFPELAGKLDGSAIRVPTPNVFVVDFTFVPSKPTSVEAINRAIVEQADGRLKGVLGYTKGSLVSIDFNHDPRSSILHLDRTRTLDGGKVARILSWYDNEWGFSNRMIDTAVSMGKCRSMEAI